MNFPSRQFIPFICGLLLTSALTSFAQQARDWTTTDGKKHSGSIMFMSSKSITIKGTRGMVSIPFTKLSPADQQYISQLKSKTKKITNPGIPISNLPPGMNKTKSTLPLPTAVSRPSSPPKPPAAIQKTWPSEVKTDFSPADIITVTETRREGYVYRSPHFEFRSPIRLPHRVVREFSLVFEATYDLASAMPIGLNPKPGGNGYYVTQLYDTSEEYLAAGGPIGSSGAFFPAQGKIHVPLSSLGVTRTANNIKVNRGGAGSTLIHEVTHQVMMRWLPLIPMWIGEGFAEITSALPYETGRFKLTHMSTPVRKNTGRGPGAGRSFDMTPLPELMNMSAQTWNAAVADGTSQQNYRSAMVLTYYFLRLDGNEQGGRFHAFINARLKGSGGGKDQQKYLLDGRSYEQLQKDVARAWRDKGLKISYRK
ncbi:MAG: hypothetical protein GXP30_00445 [Verrucomicrobia bacterium]|nr:hypothetical protein [Verrucomicrobiota bacterium]